MGIIRDRWKEPHRKGIYIPTNKELEGWDTPFMAKEDTAYWMLAGKIRDELGSGGGTVNDIYHQVTGPLGLSSYDTIKLLQSAERRGYLVKEV